MRKIFFILLIPAFQCLCDAQEKLYFQQEVNYKINVLLDDKKHELVADESMEYINNSPDELTCIWFHIWPNAYRNNNTALAKQLIADGNLKYYFASPSERGYIDKIDFKVNGQPVKTETHPDYIDIVRIILNEPLKPGSRITISTPFQVKIPSGVFSRLGHIGQQYQVTQWYPKPAVYDKYGWHAIPYLNQGEFYSEFGSFDVSITLPENYVVGATGTLVNGEKETAWLMKNAEETKAIEKYNPHDTTTPPSSSEKKTLRYQAFRVHDFGWFADKRYHVLHDEVELPYSKKKVDTWVMFTNLYGEYWKKATRYVGDAVYYYSLWNGDYPYPHATAVDGALSAGAGMEYPMITVIGRMGSDKELDRVIAHEVGHNWFYGVLGSNERDHAWMDEGINSFNENRYMKTKYPPDSAKSGRAVTITGRERLITNLLGVPNLSEEVLFNLAYRFNAVMKLDQPVDLTSAEYTNLNYGAIVYGKTAIILAYLQAYLGTELYDKCAQKYFDTWKFHHPYPEDIKKVYEEVSGKDLSWFFDNLVKTTNKVDYKICGLAPVLSKADGGKSIPSLNVKIKNKGGINSPFSISAIKDGKILSTQWYEGFAGKRQLAFSFPGREGLDGAISFDRLAIDAQNQMPDINRQNNTLKTNGLCKKTEPFNLRIFGVMHNTDKTQLFWTPVMGWNNYNRFMLGAALYNNLLIEKKIEWILMPLYGFGNKDLAGGAGIHYNMHPDKIFQTVRLGVNAERYSYSDQPLRDLNFNKITPELILEIKKKHLNNSLKQTIFIRQVNVWKDFANGDYSVSPPVYRYDTNHVAINDFVYRIDNNRKINPYNITWNVQQNQEFVKSSIIANYRVTFKQKRKGLDIRFFAGKLLDNKNLKNGNYYFYSSDGNRSGGAGYHDYMYEDVFLGRSETSGFLANQFRETEGAMKVYTPLGRTRDWAGALNLNCSLPGKLPLSLFADAAAFSKDRMSTVGMKQQYLLYDFGLHLSIIKNIVDVYVPLLMSSDIKSTFYINNSDLHRPTPSNPDPDPFKRTMRMIRFTFNIQKLNPFELVRNLSL